MTGEWGAAQWQLLCLCRITDIWGGKRQKTQSWEQDWIFSSCLQIAMKNPGGTDLQQPPNNAAISREVQSKFQSSRRELRAHTERVGEVWAVLCYWTQWKQSRLQAPLWKLLFQISQTLLTPHTSSETGGNFPRLQQLNISHSLLCSW